MHSHFKLNSRVPAREEMLSTAVLRIWSGQTYCCRSVVTVRHANAAAADAAAFFFKLSSSRNRRSFRAFLPDRTFRRWRAASSQMLQPHVHDMHRSDEVQGVHIRVL